MYHSTPVVNYCRRSKIFFVIYVFIGTILILNSDEIKKKKRRFLLC